MTTIIRVRGRRLQERRRAYFAKHPLCVRCRERGKVSLATALDHKVPLAKGGPDTEDNWQGLCDPCHDIKTADDFGHKVKGCDAHGIPTDPNHPWHKGAA